MTEFIIGKACADVSQRLRAKLIKDVKTGTNVTLIVPDQYVFETEKLLYRALAETGDTRLFACISVTTFNKLSEELISRYAGEKKPADDITKSILMYRAVSETHDDLEAFGRIATKQGFAAKMTSTVAMLKTAGVSAASLNSTLSAVKEDFRDSSPALFAKLSDIGRIYSAYDALLSQSYSDKLDSTMNAARLAAENGFFKGCTVYCDGFSDFSKGQTELLLSIIDLADDVTFAFTSETDDNSRDIFTTVNGCIALLREHSENADKQTIGFDRTICDNERFSTPALATVSERIYAGSRADCSSDGIRVIKADDVYSEMEFVAAEIRRLVTTEGMSYSDIAVLCSDPAEYITPIESAFDKYEIPLFADIPESILHMPLVNLLLSLLEVLKSFTTENVLSYVKSGFIQKSDGKPLTMREINDFEDYIYEWGIKSENLKQPFPDIKGKTPRAEAVRAEIVPPLLNLREQLKNCTGDEITKSVCNFLFDVVGVQRAVAAHCKSAGSELLSDSDEKLIASYQTLWNTMLEIFEGLYSGLSGYKIGLSEYRDLVRDICAGATLAKPPQVIDSVLAGDIARTRIDGAKAVFIVGASYGKFPNESYQSGIFSEYEAELLGESVVKLAMNRKERYCYERYLAYRALSAPSERLYITYPLLSSSCSKMSPSDVIMLISEIFGKDITEYAGSFGDEFYCSTIRAAQQRFAAVCGSDTDKRATLKCALQKVGAGNFTDKLEALTQKRFSAYKHKLDPVTAEALFRSKTCSATKLERLNQCRFEYFCSNGLRIREKKRRDLSSMEIGNAVHYVLQKMLEKYCAIMDRFISLTRAELSDETRKLLDEYKENELGGDYAKSLRFSYLYKNLTTGAVDILILLQTEFAARDYRPKFFELRIGGENNTATSPAANDAALDIASVPEAVLSDTADVSNNSAEIPKFEDSNIPGSSRTVINTPALSVKVRDNIAVNITGIIDRADIFTDENGNEYIRVVDYKTGAREFSMVNVYYGINTQMLLYLIALCDANKELRAGGVSYLPARVTEPSDKRTAAFTLLANDHIQSGMLVASDAASAEMNKYAGIMAARSGVKPEKFIPKSENSLSEEEFERLSQSCKEQTKTVLGKLYSGDIDAIPTVYKEKSATRKTCTYCRFESICGHTEREELHALPPENDDDTDEKEGEQLELD